jgi:Family of unknown function (DUF6527)
VGIPLAIAEPAGIYRRSLRRFTFSGRGEPLCPATTWGHNASVDLGDVPDTEHERVRGDNWPHDDPAWPARCAACGYWFGDTGEWQRNDNPIYRLPDGAEFVFKSSFGMVAPPGTMIRAEWYDEFADIPGEAWIISLPGGGEWITTQRATGGGHWEVTGTPPNITAHPSIWFNSPNGWHGWIRNGVLVDA